MTNIFGLLILKQLHCGMSFCCCVSCYQLIQNIAYIISKCCMFIQTLIFGTRCRDNASTGVLIHLVYNWIVLCCSITTCLFSPPPIQYDDNDSDTCDEYNHETYASPNSKCICYICIRK